MKILAERMKVLRNECNLKQDEMAKVLGVSLSAYCRYEHGERIPDAQFIVTFSDYCKVSADYLLGRKDERN